MFGSTRPRLRWTAALVAVTFVAGLLLAQRHLDRELRRPQPLVAPLHWIPLLPSPDALPPATLAEVEVPVSRTVRRGETLVDVFEDAGLDRSEANRATYAALEHMDPRKLRAGTELAFYRRQDDSLSRVVLPVGREGEVHLVRDADEWRSDWREFVYDVREQVVRGRLESDLSSALDAAGAPFALATALSDVLQWDLDFNRDLRKGDEFAIFYRSQWLEGRFAGIESVEAAIYRNQGRRIEAYRFGEGRNYYDSEGRPLRKQFLKSPLPFTRVTSRFSHSRLHPVLNVRRPHYGVDYGAPTGTPVRVTGNGVVTFRGRSKGAGNMVRVRHPNGYETSYLHLSRFHANACTGCRVGQGDLIGYVGATGLATAPHLDYRVKKGGRYMDPLQLKIEPAPPLVGDALASFQTALQGLQERLDLRAPALLASHSPQQGSELETAP